MTAHATQPAATYVSRPGRILKVETCTYVRPSASWKLHLNGTTTPVSMHFACTREVDLVAAKVKRIYDTVVEGNAHTLLNENPAACHASFVTGNCGNVRDHLTECRCEELHRIKHHTLRLQYENRVKDKIVELAMNGQKTINIALFATGGLHGELVLMMRTIAQLKEKFKGTINLYLIDLVYSDAIRHAVCFTQIFDRINGSYPWNLFTGSRADVEQFLSEMAQVLPRTISVEATFFASHDDYIERAQSNPNFTHDLVVGSDIDDTSKEIIEIQRKASRSKEAGIVLAKNKGRPVICYVKEGLVCQIVHEISTPATTTAAAVIPAVDKK